MSTLRSLTSSQANGDVHALRGYAICTVPRSGSNWLGQLLGSTGVLGNPLEYFNGPGRRQLTDPSYPDDPQQQVERVLTMGKTPNGIYGVKLFAPQFQEIESRVRLSRDLPNLRFIFLRRQDVLGQAISWARALQTHQYRTTQAVQGDMFYDPALILDRIRQIFLEYSQWSAYFARTGMSPIEILYEDLLDDPWPAVDRIAGLFGHRRDVQIRPDRIDIEIQRDAVNEEWRRRFLAEAGDRDRL